MSTSNVQLSMEMDFPLILIQSFEERKFCKSDNEISYFINEYALATSHRDGCYNDHDMSKEEEITARQISSDLMAKDTSPLKVEFTKLETEEESKEWQNVQIKLSASSICKNIIKRLLGRFPEVKINVTLKYTILEGFGQGYKQTSINFQGVNIDRVNFILTQTVWLQQQPYPISSWRKQRSIVLILTAYISKAKIYPWKYHADSNAAVNGIKKMLEDGTPRDMTILAQNGAKVRCHKSILYERSPVLRAMIESGLQESQTGRLEMIDMSDKGVRAFIRYLYHNDMEGLSADIEIIFELLYAAHKYDLPRLEAEMIECLLMRKCEDFTLEQAFAIYMFVQDITIAFLLRMKLARIFKWNWKQVEAMSEYKELCENRPEDAAVLRHDLIRTSITSEA